MEKIICNKCKKHVGEHNSNLIVLMGNKEVKPIYICSDCYKKLRILLRQTGKENLIKKLFLAEITEGELPE